MIQRYDLLGHLPMDSMVEVLEGEYIKYVDYARLKAELEAMRKDAAVGKLVRSKMLVAYGIPVLRCMITREEIDEAMKGE